MLIDRCDQCELNIRDYKGVLFSNIAYIEAAPETRTKSIPYLSWK